ncbi:MAG: acylneuraminate cytidylyltransferase [Candidatus Magnetoglobus multicellularis str. Araruama]|uniref:Acylneuraminate cytidylyltransferase n=1 Tax=Candidatus Magnetoglobus multicellularis str. Araruama TaxID=890399 RepID=A0A1V1NU17_9BACT|nr:MAG: acylneuraminate cytidylyltransferase [Candidatus Magnetoglobus multicellularis str. Araruama]
MKNINAIVTARNTSTRLPNKMLKSICNQKAIDITIARAKMTGFPVILATSAASSDDIFETIADKAQIKIFRGALRNKLKRWRDCFNYYNIDGALLVDGDDLLYDYDIGKRAITQLSVTQGDMIVHPENIICGFFTYAIHKKAFPKMSDYTHDANLNTDVIVEYIKKSQLTTAHLPLNEWEQNRDFRLTLDYQEDLEMFTHLISQIGYKASGKEIVNYLEQHNDIVQMNLFRQKDFLDNQQRFNQKVLLPD